MCDFNRMMNWMQSFSTGFRDVLSRFGEAVHFSSGETMIEVGECETHLFIITSGEVDVLAEDGRIRLVAGEVLGEMSFLDNRLRTATAIAVGNVAARRIEREDFFQSLSDRPRDIGIFVAALEAVQKSRLGAPKSEGKTARAYVEELSRSAFSHRGVCHSYLKKLAASEFPDMHWALADFAHHYYAYSSHFPRYLTALISRLEQPEHRTSLLENLTEEAGHYEEDELAALEQIGVEREWIVNIPHPLLFQRFRDALGMREDRGTNEHVEVVVWREMFLNVLTYGSPAEALGALGMGTENIVSHIYTHFIAAIDTLGTIHPRDSVFFPLHTAVDDHHQAALQDIAATLADDPLARVEMKQGMHKALALRASFWSWLQERAQNPERYSID